MFQMLKLNRTLKFSLPLMLVILLFIPKVALAHRDGCHRWHSCPSDSGSYVCGDLGYDSECPKAAVPEAVAAPVNVPAAPVEAQAQPVVDVQPEAIVINPFQASGFANASANIRSGPGTNYPIVGKADQGVAVKILGKNATDDWYNLDSGQWIKSELVDITTDAPTAAPTEIPTVAASPELTVTHKNVTVLEGANLRQGPNTDFAIVGHAIAGQVLEVIGQNTDGSWTQLSDQTWIFSTLVKDL